MSNAPCVGCPPHCNDCVFSVIPDVNQLTATKAVVRSKEAYGCIRPDGGAVVLSNGKLGMMRNENFHPVTDRGAAFLKESGNQLALHC